MSYTWKKQINFHKGLGWLDSWKETEVDFMSFNIIAVLVVGFSFNLIAGVKPGELDLTKGPKVYVTYTNWYNDSDLEATCVIYSDGSAMFLADGIVPLRKPRFIKLNHGELTSVIDTAVTATSSLESPKFFGGYNGIPSGENIEGKLGALYFGKGSEYGPRFKMDLVIVPEKSQLEKLVRGICGYGDDL